jgi:hypothetical protein
MPGLDPGIHLLAKKLSRRGMDCRVEPGNDEMESERGRRRRPPTAQTRTTILNRPSVANDRS